jgi:hypothetical protein
MQMRIRNYFYRSSLLLLVILLGCSRDDICTEDTPTTPLLIITFKDIANPNQSKSVPDLAITPVLSPETVVFRGTTDSIAIPLDVNSDLTQYNFVKDSSDDEFNIDLVTLRYSRDDIYVNRACAFKTFFEELAFQRDDESGTNWIVSGNVNLSTVENEEQAHLTIFH